MKPTTNPLNQIMALTTILLIGNPAFAAPVPHQAEIVDGSVQVTFETIPGMTYQIEHSAEGEFWTSYPDQIYGFGQRESFLAYHIPAPLSTAPSPTNGSGELASTQHHFSITAFDDGSAWPLGRESLAISTKPTSLHSISATEELSLLIS